MESISVLNTTYIKHIYSLYFYSFSPKWAKAGFGVLEEDFEIKKSVVLCFFIILIQTRENSMGLPAQ